MTTGKNVSHLTDTIIEQIIAIRDSGETNMFDALTVQRLANERGFFELVIFIEEYRKEYVSFILNGKKKTNE